MLQIFLIFYQTKSFSYDLVSGEDERRSFCILQAMWPSGVGRCILLWFSSGFKGAKPHVTTCLFGNVVSPPFWIVPSSPTLDFYWVPSLCLSLLKRSPLSETLIRLISTEAFLAMHVNFNHVNIIEEIYKVLRLNVKLSEVLVLCLLTTVHTLPLFNLRV